MRYTVCCALPKRTRAAPQSLGERYEGMDGAVRGRVVPRAPSGDLPRNRGGGLPGSYRHAETGENTVRARGALRYRCSRGLRVWGANEDVGWSEGRRIVGARVRGRAIRRAAHGDRDGADGEARAAAEGARVQGGRGGHRARVRPEGVREDDPAVPVRGDGAVGPGARERGAHRRGAHGEARAARPARGDRAGAAGRGQAPDRHRRRPASREGGGAPHRRPAPRPARTRVRGGRVLPAVEPGAPLDAGGFRQDSPARPGGPAGGVRPMGPGVLHRPVARCVRADPGRPGARGAASGRHGRPDGRQSARGGHRGALPGRDGGAEARAGLPVPHRLPDAPHGVGVVRGARALGAAGEAGDPLAAGARLPGLRARRRDRLVRMPGGRGRGGGSPAPRYRGAEAGVRHAGGAPAHPSRQGRCGGAAHRPRPRLPCGGGHPGAVPGPLRARGACGVREQGLRGDGTRAGRGDRDRGAARRLHGGADGGGVPQRAQGGRGAAPPRRRDPAAGRSGGLGRRPRPERGLGAGERDGAARARPRVLP